ncbi:MerR family transcriptional regulator [Actinobacillus pleuropneumoniae]|nr:MerR family transcriptional regulator [Actinobacillus pleuropneumoniae]
MSKFFKIKQASEQTGVHLETIRYYEKQGLIALYINKTAIVCLMKIS